MSNGSPYFGSPDEGADAPEDDVFMYGDLLRVCDGGSLDGLIGVVDEFLDASYEAVEAGGHYVFLQLYFPLTERGQSKHGLVGVNDFLPDSLEILRESRGRHAFENIEGNFEKVNKQEL